MYPPSPNYEEEPPAYRTYGETASFLADHDSSPRHQATMRLLPNSSHVDDDLSVDVESGAAHQYGIEYPDEGS
jgi:chitin synthase